MCIIAIKPAGKKMFDEEAITRMFNKNPDGAGLCFYSPKDKCVKIRKGFMDVNSLLTYLGKYDFTKVPVILHFRIGTSGHKNEANCHPYAVSMENPTRGNCDLAVAHNGIMTDYNPPVGADYNDTRNFIMKVLTKLPKNFLLNEGICSLIGNSINGSRLAFLDDKGKIFTIGNFIEDDGYYYSNNGYKEYKPSYYSYTYPTSYTNCEQGSLFDLEEEGETAAEDEYYDEMYDYYLQTTNMLLERAGTPVRVSESEYIKMKRALAAFCIQLDEDYYLFEEFELDEPERKIINVYYELDYANNTIMASIQ